MEYKDQVTEKDLDIWKNGTDLRMDNGRVEKTNGSLWKPMIKSNLFKDECSSSLKHLELTFSL